MFQALLLQETFKNEGLDFTMDGLTGNSLNSHRLIAYAGRQGYDIQDKVVEEIFKAYFTEASHLHWLKLRSNQRCTDISFFLRGFTYPCWLTSVVSDIGNLQ